MKKYILSTFYMLLLFVSALTVTGCEVVGDIFGAGVYTGMFIVIFLIVLIIFLVVKMMRRK